MKKIKIRLYTSYLENGTYHILKESDNTKLATAQNNVIAEVIRAAIQEHLNK